MNYEMNRCNCSHTDNWHSNGEGFCLLCKCSEYKHQKTEIVKIDENARLQIDAAQDNAERLADKIIQALGENFDAFSIGSYHDISAKARPIIIKAIVENS